MLATLSPTGLHARLVIDLEEALCDPSTLDGRGVMPLETNVEVEYAAFDGREHVLVMGSADSELFDEESDGLAPGELGRWSLRDRRWEWRTRLAEHAGILMPMGSHAVGFYEHPKLIDISSGEIVHRWTEVNTGRHQHSYRAQPLEGPNATPPLALDPLKRRFAVADGPGVTAVQLG